MHATSNRKSSLWHQSDRCSSCSKAQWVEWLCCMFPYSRSSTDLFKDFFFFFKMMVSAMAASDRLLPHFSRQQVPSFFNALSPIISLQSAARWWRSCIRGAQGITPLGHCHCYRICHGGYRWRPVSRDDARSGHSNYRAGRWLMEAAFGLLLITVWNDTLRLYNWE